MRVRKSYKFTGGMDLALSDMRSFPLPRVNDLIELRFLIYGILTVGVANATLVAGWMTEFVKEVIVKATGGGIDSTPIAMDGFQIGKTMWLKNGAFPRYDNPGLTFAVGTNPFLIEVICRFTPDGIIEGVSSLPARYCDTIDLEVTLGASTDVATPGGGGTAVVGSLSILDANAVEEKDWGPQFERWVKTEKRIVIGEALAAADIKKLADITGTGKLAAITIETETAAGADSDDILSDMIIKVQAKGGNQVELDGAHFKSVQASNLAQYKLPQYLSSPPFTNVGFARWEFDKTGMGDPDELVSVESFQSVEFHAKCILAGKLWLTVETWRKLRYA